MASDPSIYNQLGANVVQPVNPLALQAQSANTANALLNVQSARRVLDAQTGEQQAYTSALKPDGSYDPSILQSGLSGLPTGAGAAVAQGLSLQRGQQTRSSEAQSKVAQMIVSLGTLPDSAMTGDTFRQGISQGVQSGSMTPNDGQSAMSDLPPDGSPPAAYRLYVLRHGAQNLSTPEGQALLYGKTSMADVGGKIQPLLQQSAAMGGVVTQPLGAVRTGLTPAEGSQPTQIGIDPVSKAPIMGTREQFVDRATGGQSPLGTGRVPAALMNPNKPPSAQNGNAPPPSQDGTTPPPAPDAGIVTGLGPAQQAALTTQGTDSAKAFQDIADQGVQARSQNAILGNMLGDAAQFTPGMTRANEYKMFATRQAPDIARWFGISPEKVTANESFDKLANQIATTQGAGSDARLSVAQHANPSSGISAPGVDQIIRQLQGNADYTQVRSKLAALYPNQSDRAGFETNVGTTLDPRAFQFDRMTPDQQKTYATSLSPTDRAAVHTAYLSAAKQGLLSSGYRTPPPSPASSQPQPATPRGY